MLGTASSRGCCPFFYEAFNVYNRLVKRKKDS